MQSGVCLECAKDYEILTAGAPCTKKIVIENCQVPDNKNAGKCLICNYGYFPDGNKCTKVSELCKDFNVQNGKCTSCISTGFTLTDGICVDPNCVSRIGGACSVCVPNFLYSSTEKICKLNDPNCKTLAIASCLECKQDFYVSSEKLCKTLPLNCQSADPSGTCLSCASGFEIYKGGCIKTLIIPNCISVDSFNNRCLNCADRFFASGNACVPVSPSCNTYNANNGWCLSCKGTNMALQADGSCVVQAPPQQTQQVIQTSVQTNSQFGQQTAGGQQGSSQSQSQQSGQSSGVQVQSSTGTAYNQQISIINQQVTNGGTQIFSDVNCREYNGGRCMRCSNRYFVNPDNRCVPVNPLCKEANQAGECTLCYPGYRVESGKCIISQASDANCRVYKGQQCSECYQGFYYNQGERTCKRVNPLCKSSNPQSGACTGCYPGYSLNNLNGNCEVFFKDPNCK